MKKTTVKHHTRKGAKGVRSHKRSTKTAADKPGAGKELAAKKASKTDITKVIGKTGSGKKIYNSFTNFAHKGFDYSDHVDASAAHDGMAIKATKSKQHDKAAYHTKCGNMHAEAAANM